MISIDEINRLKPENLKALCQKCHLNYDKEHHAETRRKTKELKSGQLKLIKEQTNEK